MPITDSSIYSERELLNQAFNENTNRLDVSSMTATMQVSGSAGGLNAEAIPSTDVSAYRWVSVQISGTWAGTLTFQASNDNTNWLPAILFTTSASSGAGGSTTTGNTLVHGPVYGRYFRVAMTAYTSGTATAVAILSSQPSMVQTMGVAAGQAGSWTLSPSTTATAATLFRNAAVLATPLAVKTSAGRIYGYHLHNPNTAVSYVHLYNATTANVTVGTTTPAVSLGIPANASLDLSSAVALLPFGTAISVAATTTVGGATAPATGIVANIYFV